MGLFELFSVNYKFKSHALSLSCDTLCYYYSIQLLLLYPQMIGGCWVFKVVFLQLLVPDFCTCSSQVFGGNRGLQTTRLQEIFLSCFPSTIECESLGFFNSLVPTATNALCTVLKRTVKLFKSRRPDSNRRVHCCILITSQAESTNCPTAANKELKPNGIKFSLECNFYLHYFSSTLYLCTREVIYQNQITVMQKINQLENLCKTTFSKLPRFLFANSRGNDPRIYW